MKYIVIDGNNICCRYNGIPEINALSSSKGDKTGVLMMFTHLLIRICQKNPDAMTVVFDPVHVVGDGRHSPDIDEHIEKIIGLLEILKIDHVRSVHEADRLIASIVNWITDVDREILVDIYSWDKDFHQLVSDRVRCIVPSAKGHQVIDLEMIREKYGMDPEMLPEYYALVGDKVDNIPGVYGIGDKKAKALLEKHGNLWDSLKALEEDPKWEGAYDSGVWSFQEVYLRNDQWEIWKNKYPISIKHLYEEGIWQQTAKEYLHSLEIDSIVKQMERGNIFGR